MNSMMALSARPSVQHETRNLARCQDGLARQVREIIIVNTGSTDVTLFISRRYTVKVIEQAWNDHFAESNTWGQANGYE